MKILIVEDDLFKLNALKCFIEKHFKDCKIDIARSYQTGCDAAFSDKYDLLILDMTLPNFDIVNNDNGGNTLKNGGELIMRELLEENVFFNAVIISQYETFGGETIEQIDNRLKSLCSSKYHGWITYSTNNNDWQEKLLNTIKNVIDSNN